MSRPKPGLTEQWWSWMIMMKMRECWAGRNPDWLSSDNPEWWWWWWESVEQAETRSDWAVMIPNDSDNDNRVIPGRDPDWLSSGWPWIILQWQEQWQQRDPETQVRGPRIIELIRSEVLTLFMFVDNSRDSRETRTHKLKHQERLARVLQARPEWRNWDFRLFGIY